MSRAVIALGLATVSSGCAGGERVALRPRSPSACVMDAYKLELPAGGGFVLNDEPRDSAGIARWLRDVLPHRAGTGRTVHVRMTAGRETELRWLVPAVARAGGAAYEFDPECRLEIP